MKLHPANDKLREAEFFFMLMEQHSDHDEFRYFLSAFLSALISCTEHDLVHSSDLRFNDWFEEIKKTHLSNIDLRNLREMRRHAVHKKGKRRPVRLPGGFPEGIETTRLEIEIDSRSEKPVTRYKTAEMEEFQEYPVARWVWKIQGEPDVMELCSKGLQVVREIIKSRGSRGFPD